MQISSINLLTASWLFLCFISPLQSDPQRSYRTNSDVYNYPERRFYPVKPVNDPRYIGTSIPKPPIKEHYNYQQMNPQARWTPNRQIYNQNYPREGLNNYEAKHVPRRFDKEIYYNYNYEGVENQNDDNLRTARPSYRQLDIIEDENDVDEEEIMEKMQILDRVLSEDSINKDFDSNTIEEKIIFESIPEETKRVARQIRNKRPGFFWTLARLTFETYNDTKSAIQQISNIIGNNISPDSATQRTTTLVPPTTPSTTSFPDQNKMSSNLANANTTAEVTTMATTTTTEETYVLTRGGLQSLIRRNVLGLIRLFNVEWKEALNESEASVREFQKNLGNQIGVYLQDNPNVF